MNIITRYLIAVAAATVFFCEGATSNDEVVSSDSIQALAAIPCLTTVSGIINGDTWTSGGSPYCVDDEIFVKDLTITEGVTIDFLDNYTFTILPGNGIINATGSSSNKILFRNSSETGWQGIVFDNTPAGSQMSHFNVEGSVNSGIRIVNSLPLLEDFGVAGNSATNGGGMNIALTTIPSDEELLLRNCIINNNKSTSHGGGVIANITSGSLRFVDCTLNGNRANSGSSLGNYYGGGAYINAAGGVVFEGGDQGCVISDNVTVGRCSGHNCSAHGRGAGVYIGSGDVTLDACLVKNNRAAASGTSFPYAYGGGVFIESGTLSAVNSIFSSNVANASYSATGGGIFNSQGTVSCINTDVVYNIPNGLYNSGNVHGTNCIFFFNQTAQIVGGGATELSYSDVEGGWPGEGNIDCDPFLMNPPDDLHLSDGSCAIDSGDSSLPALPPTDKDGNARVQDVSVDMGPYEHPGPSLLCEGDFDKDGDVDGTDLSRFSKDFGKTTCPIIVNPNLNTSVNQAIQGM